MATWPSFLRQVRSSLSLFDGHVTRHDGWLGLSLGPELGPGLSLCLSFLVQLLIWIVRLSWEHHMAFREREDLGDHNDTLAYIHVQVGIGNSLCQGWPGQILPPKGPSHLTWVSWSRDTSLLSSGVCLLLE